jgi:hypothetical protein
MSPLLHPMVRRRQIQSESLGTATPPVFSKTECCLFRRLNPIFYSALIKTKQALVHLADEPDPAPR